MVSLSNHEERAFRSTAHTQSPRTPPTHCVTPGPDPGAHSIPQREADPPSRPAGRARGV